MSLIPYSSQDRESQQVVLRHQSTLVLYDPKNRQLALRDLPQESRAIDTITLCPYCHQAMPGSERPQEGRSHGSSSPEAGYVNRDYFRMLDASTRLPAPGSASPHTSQSPPRFRLPHLGERVRVEEAIDAHHQRDSQEPSSPRRASTGGISSAAFSPGYFKRFFVEEGILGKGGKGIVLLVRHVLDGVSLGQFACKRVPVGDNHDWLAKVLTEVQLLQQLSHTNLVSYRHVWLESVEITKFGPSVPCAFILQQYCDSGDLHNYILKGTSAANSKEDQKERIRRRSRGQPELPTLVPRRIPFDHILSFFSDIASGLHHLHSNGFIHRDLKPSNCLLMNPHVAGQAPRVLVSDFGEAQIENAMRSNTGATGTISYCAPEVLKRVTPEGAFGNFTAKSDIFSLGMILYFMCFGNLPYECADSINEENEDLDNLRVEISAWEGISEKDRTRPDLPERLYLSLERLLSPNPALRPSAEEILQGLHGNVPATEDSGHMKRSAHPPTGQEHEVGGSALGFRRISPVSDTPTAVSRSTSPKRQGYSTFGDSYKPTISASHPTRSTILRGLPMSPEDRNIISSDAVTPPPSTASGSTGFGGTFDTSLILRPRLDSPTSRRLSEIPRVLPFLTRRARILAALRSSEFAHAVKFSVFLTKAASLLSPCSPLAPNPWVVYPLLGLAVFDFTGRPSIRSSFLLMLFHIVAYSMANMSGALCSY